MDPLESRRKAHDAWLPPAASGRSSMAERQGGLTHPDPNVKFTPGDLELLARTDPNFLPDGMTLEEAKRLLADRNIDEDVKQYMLGKISSRYVKVFECFPPRLFVF